jgi:antitoxin (DNA-binding transcriptional repressor) of toxin-antitoxin stability system
MRVRRIGETVLLDIFFAFSTAVRTSIPRLTPFAHLVHTQSVQNGGGAKMEATLLDMRRNPKKILDAIARNETVALTSRGKTIARVEPIAGGKRPSASEHEAFGMWSDRSDMADPAAYVRQLRKGRFDAL